MKKILAAALTLSLLVAVFPLSALAEDSIQVYENDPTSVTTTVIYTDENQPMGTLFAVKIPTTVYLDGSTTNMQIELDEAYPLPTNFGVKVTLDPSVFTTNHSDANREHIELLSTNNSQYFKSFTLSNNLGQSVYSSSNLVAHYINGKSQPDGRINFNAMSSADNPDPSGNEYSGTLTFNIKGAYEAP